MTRNQYTTSRFPRAGLKTYRDASEKIIKIVGEYDNKPIWVYLKGLTYNFDVQKK